MIAISQENFKKIKIIIEEFFEKTTFDGDISVSLEDDSTISIAFKTDDPKVLIGMGGQTLIETQHLLKAMLKKQVNENFFINLDINNYKKKKLEYLKELARDTADEVSLTKKEKELGPMPAYERRIIHMELAGRTDIKTESAGEEPDRKIIIKVKEFPDREDLKL